jgi:hypothetical protein
MYYFATPPIKLKLGQQIGRRLLIANHLNQSLRWVNQKHWAVVRSYLLHFFLQVRGAAAAFTKHGSLCHFSKTIFLSQTGMCWIFFMQFYCAESDTKHQRRCSKQGLWQQALMPCKVTPEHMMCECPDMALLVTYPDIKVIGTKSKQFPFWNCINGHE